MKDFFAALMLFTRLPLWRWISVPTESFKNVVSYWSLCGWITGGSMALVFWGASQILSADISIVLALLTRLLLTGALHEDGLADFFDGFGGGTDKTSILRIMKDTHIGTYGVLSLIGYYLSAFVLLKSLPVTIIPMTLLCGDTFCKWVVSHLILLLPYARKEEDSKVKIVYNRMKTKEIILSAIGGLLPLIFFPFKLFPTLLFPVILFAMLYRLINKKLQGYTGDCMGAVFLLCEVMFWWGLNIVLGTIFIM